METNETVLVSEHNAFSRTARPRISHSKQNIMNSVLLICRYDLKRAHTVLVYRLNHYVFERHLDAWIKPLS